MWLPWRAREPKASHFWDWFLANEERLFTSIGMESPAFRDLARELRRFNPGLVFEVGNIENRRRELVVSADGIAELFPAVEELVCAAPALDRWCLVPLRPRRGSRTIEFGNVRVTPDDVRVACARDGHRLGLTVYIRGYHETPSQLYEQVAFLLLDAAIGEYDVESRIGYIEVEPLLSREGTISLDELGEIVDELSEAAA